MRSRNARSTRRRSTRIRRRRSFGSRSFASRTIVPIRVTVRSQVARWASSATPSLRRDGFKSPIILLTGHDSDSDEILGLESGANDYVTKPFRFSVLLARIRAALRQHDQSEDVVFTIGPYSFQPANKLLEAQDGGKVRLTDKETSILKYLYRQGPKTITRDVLLKEVWGYNNRVTTHTLETHIYRLRQKIERDPSNARLLVTEEGGYRLVP